MNISDTLHCLLEAHLREGPGTTVKPCRPDDPIVSPAIWNQVVREFQEAKEKAEKAEKTDTPPEKGTV